MPKPTAAEWFPFHCHGWTCVSTDSLCRMEHLGPDGTGIHIGKLKWAGQHAVLWWIDARGVLIQKGPTASQSVARHNGSVFSHHRLDPQYLGHLRPHPLCHPSVIGTQCPTRWHRSSGSAHASEQKADHQRGAPWCNAEDGHMWSLPRPSLWPYQARGCTWWLCHCVEYLQSLWGNAMMAYKCTHVEQHKIILHTIHKQHDT